VSIPVLFLNALIIYFVLAQIINLLFRLAERRVNARFERRTGRQATDLASDAEMAGAG
jgi:polar amino acid transport system permease protein